MDLFYFKTVNVDYGGGMELGDDWEGGLIVRCCFGDEGVDREDPGYGLLVQPPLDV